MNKTRNRFKFPEKPVQLNVRLLRHERAIVAKKAAMSKLTVVEYCRTALGLPSGLERVEYESQDNQSDNS